MSSLRGSATPARRKLDREQDNNMDNGSFEFVFFGLTAAIISNFSRSSVWRSIVLFAASLVFLGFLAHDLTVFLPLIGFVLFGYGCLLLLERGWSRALPWILTAVVLVYVWLKKYTFLP